MRFQSTLQGLRGLGRFGKISRVLIKHGIAGSLTGRGAKDPKTGKPTSAAWAGYLSPVRLRMALEELGPSFIKLGQLLSTRADLLPLAYIEELKKLQDQVPPVPVAGIQATIEAELGQPLDQLFAEFDTTPLAAASVAQVHRAECFDGRLVAVKVIRPGIAKTIRSDIRLMHAFAKRLEKSLDIGRVIGAVNVVREFERTVFRELDMLAEAAHMDKFNAMFAKSEEIGAPEVHWDLTTRSVLVMEYIEGVKMDQVAAIEAMDLDPKEIALIGLRSFSRQLMEFGFFHADPHPANTIVRPDGRVALIDFGITGYLDEETMRQIAMLFLGFAEHDYDMVMAALTDVGLVDETTMDVRGFRSALKDVSEPFYGRSLQTISVREVYEQIMHLVHSYQVRMPRNLLLLIKTFIQTESLGKILGSDASLIETTRPYARRLLQRGYDTQKIFRNLGSDARAFGSGVRAFPQLMNEMLRRTVRGKHRLELFHGGLEDLDVKLERAFNRLIMGIVISASTIAAALVLHVPDGLFRIPMAVLGETSISATGLLGVTGYVIATILGIWLIISIFRSGRM